MPVPSRKQQLFSPTDQPMSSGFSTDAGGNPQVGLYNMPSNLGAHLSGGAVPPMSATPSLGGTVTFPSQETPPPTQRGPVRPATPPRVDPTANTTVAPPQSGGSPIKDSLLGFLKGLGGAMIEGGYAMAHRSGGNMDDYKSHWNEDVYTGNPNSAYSRTAQDFMKATYGDRFSSPEQQAQLRAMSGDQIKELNPMYNQANYLDYLKDASRMKQETAMARINQPKSQRIGGGSRGYADTPAGNNSLLKYNKEASAHEDLMRDVNELMALSKDGDIEGLYKNPFGSSMYATNNNNAVRAKQLIEKIIAPERHRLFGASLTGNELRSANEAFGKSGYSIKQLLASLSKIRDVGAEDFAQIQAGYDPSVIQKRQQNFQQALPQSASQPSGNQSVKRFNPATGRLE